MLALAAFFSFCRRRGGPGSRRARAVRTGSPRTTTPPNGAARARRRRARGRRRRRRGARPLERLVDGRAELVPGGAPRRRATRRRPSSRRRRPAPTRSRCERRPPALAAGAAAPRRGGGWSAAAEREALAAAADALAAPRAEAAGLQSSAAEAQGRVLTGVPYSCRGDGVHADAVARRAVSRRRGERKGPPDTPHTIKTQRRSSRCTRRSSPRCSSCSSGRTRRRHR